MIAFSDSIMDEEKSEIAQILPQWESYVLHAQRSTDGVPTLETLHFLVAAKSRDEFRQWLSQFEASTKTKYTVWTSRVAAGKRVVMSQTLVCHRKTHCKRTHDPAVHKVTKNTNCPSKITVTIHAVRDQNHRYRGKFAEIANIHRLMPCEVKLTLRHNHSIGSAASLRFGQEENQATGSQTNIELKDADPLEKMDAQEENENTEEEIAIARNKSNHLLARAVAHLTQLINRSPDEMVKGLEALCEVEKMKTPSACSSLLLKLREGNSRKNRGNYIPVQATAISRRKKKLVGCRSNPGGRPRSAVSSVDTTMNIEGCGTSNTVNQLGTDNDAFFIQLLTKL